MTRYRSRRQTSTSSAAAPIVAFLLIACFGLLFVTGCSSSSSTAEKTQDDTFTQEDLARFQELSKDGNASSPVVGSGTVAVALSSADASVPTVSSSSAESIAVPAADPALRKQYDAMRATSGGQGNAYRVTNTFLNVRSEPNVTSAFVTKLDQGDLVSLVEFTNATWAKVQMPGGKQGYVSTRYISKLTTEAKLKMEQKTFEGVYFVNFAFVNVRSTPTTGGEKIGEIPGQAFVRPLSIEKDWARVTLNGKEGYVSMQYLSPFLPNFLVRQETYALPILHYAVDQEGVLASLTQHAAKLKQSGAKFLTFSDLFDTIRTQEVRDVRLPPKSAIIAVTGITAQNIKTVSEALNAAGVRATLFIQSDQVGLSAISEKTVLTLQANGFDIQSAGHTGDDLRTLTSAQTQLELVQSRTMLENITHKTVFAVAYPQGGANDRVLQQAAEAGYLFGMGSAPDAGFTRDQFLRLPSFSVTTGMTGDDVAKLVK